VTARLRATIKFPPNLPNILDLEMMIARCLSLTIRAFAAKCPDERADLIREAMELTAVMAPA
jgi:hypothetical protein